MQPGIERIVRSFRFARVMILVSLALLSACDANDPVAPRAVPRHRPDQIPPPALLALRQVFTPPTSSSADVVLANGQWVDLPVPESAWAVVRIQGGVLHTYNPQCDYTPPNWTCAGGGEPFETGPFNTQGSGGMDLWLQRVGEGGNWVYPLPPLGVSEQEAMEGLLLIAPGSAGTIWARRRVVAVVGYNPTAGTEVPKYFLTDRQTISVSKIASPLRITASEPDSAGVVTYSAEPLYGLGLRNPWGYGHLPPGMFNWRFFPGDSLSAKPEWGWPGWYQYACERQPVCRFKPPVQGRMQVDGYVEMRYAAARSEPVIQPPRPVNLACTPSVTRGDTVSCAATSEGSFRVTGWRFSDGNGTEISPPAGSSQNSSKTWAGQMVTGGTVTVYAVSGGQPQTASATINVLPRGWTFASHAQHRYSDGTGDPCLHHTPRQNTWNGVNLQIGVGCSVAKRFLQPDMFAPDTAQAFTIGQVAGGPNDSLRFVVSTNIRMLRESTYNTGLWPDAPPEQLSDTIGPTPWNQATDCGPTSNWYNFTKCKGGDPDAVITGLKHHEGWGSTGHNGHYSAAWDVVTNPATDPLRFLERQVSQRRDTFDSFFSMVRGEYQDIARMADLATLDVGNGGTVVKGNWQGQFWAWWDGDHFSSMNLSM